MRCAQRLVVNTIAVSFTLSDTEFISSSARPFKLPSLYAEQPIGWDFFFADFQKILNKKRQHTQIGVCPLAKFFDSYWRRGVFQAVTNMRYTIAWFALQVSVRRRLLTAYNRQTLSFIPLPPPCKRIQNLLVFIDASLVPFQCGDRFHSRVDLF